MSHYLQPSISKIFLKIPELVYLIFFQNLRNPLYQNFFLYFFVISVIITKYIKGLCFDIL